MDLVLDDQMILNLARRGDIIAEFPTMRLATPLQIGVRKTCCGGRNRTANNDSAHRINLVKMSITALPPDKKARLKELLKVDKITMFYKPTAGGVQQHIF